MAELRIVSYNCNSVKRAPVQVALSNLMDCCDIVALQELRLSKQELPYLNSINQNFFGSGTSNVDLCDGPINGPAHGGVGFLWSKKLGPHVRVVDYNDKRIIGAAITFSTIEMLILNVYLPYECPDNEPEFESCLGKIHAILEDCTTPYVCIVGDFNADLQKREFGKLLNEFCVENLLTVVDASQLPSTSFTYLSAAHDTTSWLDHVLCNDSTLSAINNLHIRYDLALYDHIPVCFSIDMKPNIAALNGKVQNECIPQKPNVNWAKATSNNIIMYQARCEQLLSAIEVDRDMLRCTDVRCTVHQAGIASLYSSICNSLCAAAGDSIPAKNYNGTAVNVVPGWNDYVEQYYNEAKHYYLCWKLNTNKDRQGPIYEEMKMSRARYRLALRECKLNEETIRNDKLASTLTGKNCKEFWKEIRKRNIAKMSLSSTVNGVTGENNICNEFAKSAKALLNSVKPNEYCLREIGRHMDNISYDKDMEVSANELQNAIKKLKLGKSCGPDKIFAEHIKHTSGPRLSILLSLLFTCMFTHGYMPDSLMETELVPLVKNKNGDLTAISNYRFIALANIFTKLLESVVMEKYQSHFAVSDNQFGFKEEHGTEMCLFSYKEIVNYYASRDATVFVCFLDASKAFDKVNHGILFQKLINVGLPCFVVRLFYQWYSRQSLYVKWGQEISTPFAVCNGVRQGGISSPVFFNVYMDELSTLLNNSGYGCKINGKRCNHLGYADDWSLLASSATAMQNLLRICSKYAQATDIVYNVEKSHCMYIAPKTIRGNLPNFYLDERVLSVVSSEKYLGHIVCDDMNDTKDIRNQIRQFYGRANTLIVKFGKCSFDVKLTLMRAYCTSIYCNSLWFYFLAYQMQRMKIAYNFAIRKLFHLQYRESISMFCVQNKIPTFVEIRRRSLGSIWERLSKSVNSIVRAVSAVKEHSVFHLNVRNILF